jgi:hypothetical protein
MPAWFQAILQQAATRSSRSTILTSLGWAMAILGSIWLGSIWVHASLFERLPIELLLIADVVAYLLAYKYFAVRNPDFLRSEKFTIQKMAIERNLVGDTLAGVIEVENAMPIVSAPDQKSLPEPEGDDE